MKNHAYKAKKPQESQSPINTATVHMYNLYVGLPCKYL